MRVFSMLLIWRCTKCCLRCIRLYHRHCPVTNRFCRPRASYRIRISSAESWYKELTVHGKVLLAMKYALVKFRVHLLGSKPFVVYTYHASLRTATQSPHLYQRRACWLLFFAEYNFEVKYYPGKQKCVGRYPISSSRLWAWSCHDLVVSYWVVS